MKSVRIWSFSDLYLPAFALHTERYYLSVSSPNAGKYGQENSQYGHFPRSDNGCRTELSEAVVRRCFINKVFKACFNFKKKETLTQVFFCEFCEIFKNNLFYRTSLVAACKLEELLLYRLPIWNFDRLKKTLCFLSFKKSVKWIKVLPDTPFHLYLKMRLTFHTWSYQRP